MFTDQAQSLTASLSQVAQPNQVQAIMQTLANCASPLTTRGPVNLDGAGNQAPPRGGVIASPPNMGGLGRRYPVGDTLTDYYNNAYGDDTPWSRYGSDTWDRSLAGGQGGASGAYTGDGLYWGGDRFYGNNYLYNNYSTFNNRNEFNNYNYNNFINEYLTNYNFNDTYYNDVTNNIFNNNFNEWYNKTFIDQGYYDFSTHLNSTSNSYNQTVNNFAGDNVFENTVVNNTTRNNNVINEGDVINNRTVINQGDVINNNTVTNLGDTVLNNTIINGPNTVINVNGQPVNLQKFLADLLGFVNTWGQKNFGTQAVRYLVGGNVDLTKITIPVPSDACSGGDIAVTLSPATTTIQSVSGATLNPDSCEISLTSTSVEVVTGVTATATFTPTAATKTDTEVVSGATFLPNARLINVVVPA